MVAVPIELPPVPEDSDALVTGAHPYVVHVLHHLGGNVTRVLVIDHRDTYWLDGSRIDVLTSHLTPIDCKE